MGFMGFRASSGVEFTYELYFVVAEIDGEMLMTVVGISNLMVDARRRTLKLLDLELNHLKLRVYHGLMLFSAPQN